MNCLSLERGGDPSISDENNAENKNFFFMWYVRLLTKGLGERPPALSGGFYKQIDAILNFTFFLFG